MSSYWCLFLFLLSIEIQGKRVLLLLCPSDGVGWSGEKEFIIRSRGRSSNEEENSFITVIKDRVSGRKSWRSKTYKWFLLVKKLKRKNRSVRVKNETRRSNGRWNKNQTKNQTLNGICYRKNEAENKFGARGSISKSNAYSTCKAT